MKTINIMTIKQVREKSFKYDTFEISDPEAATAAINAAFDLESDAVEKFGLISLDVKHKINGLHIVSVGQISSCHVSPRDVYQRAITNNAANIIIFHNHPSGDPTPSTEDIRITKRLLEAGQILGITLIDHIIIGDGRSYSLRKNGDI